MICKFKWSNHQTGSGCINHECGVESDRGKHPGISHECRCGATTLDHPQPEELLPAIVYRVFKQVVAVAPPEVEIIQAISQLLQQRPLEDSHKQAIKAWINAIL